MSAHSKSAQQLARQLFQLSLEDGSLSAERVAGVLAYVEQHRPPNPVMVLRAYLQLAASAVARSQARVEHAGPVSDQVLQNITAALARHYGRALTTVTQPNPALLAGLRVRVGDDVYEASIAGQLAALVI
jgi:F-type H+-transporting ATPase subunit delta